MHNIKLFFFLSLKGLVKSPPPPSEPAPPNQPTIHTCFRLPPTNLQNQHKKPQPPTLPKVKALYDYSPQDLDELELKEGAIIEVLKEHEGGWWHGRCKGKIGLFPSNYIEKI